MPIVTTSVGAEGIDAPELFGALSDDAQEFAEAVIGLLQLPEVGGAIAAKARDWAEGVYGVAAFEKRIRGLYADVIDSQ